MKRIIFLLLPLSVACSQSSDSNKAPNGLDYNGCYITSLEPKGEPIGAYFLHDGKTYIGKCNDFGTTPFTFEVNERTGQIDIYQSGELWDSWIFIEKGLWKGKNKDAPYYHNYLN